MEHIEDYTEPQLIRQINAKDTSAIKVLYCRYIKYLTAVCSRYIINEDDIRDVLQDSFLKIITSISQFEYRGTGSLKAWMTRIVVNEALRFLRLKERFEVIQYECELPEVSQDEEAEIDSIPTSIIQEMIRQLPTGYRTVFNLFVFEQKSHKEIASLLNIKENTSASQFHRAKDMLAKKINEYKSIKQASL